MILQAYVSMFKIKVNRQFCGCNSASEYGKTSWLALPTNIKP